MHKPVTIDVVWGTGAASPAHRNGSWKLTENHFAARFRDKRNGGGVVGLSMSVSMSREVRRAFSCFCTQDRLVFFSLPREGPKIGSFYFSRSTSTCFFLNTVSINTVAERKFVVRIWRRASASRKEPLNRQIWPGRTCRSSLRRWRQHCTRSSCQSRSTARTFANAP